MIPSWFPTIDPDYGWFENGSELNKNKEFDDVIFKFDSSRLDENIISSNFSSRLCQLACGTSKGTLQLFNPNRPKTGKKSSNALFTYDSWFMTLNKINESLSVIVFIYTSCISNIR